MKHDDNNAFELRGEPELEARLVAWVAGEASDFERAELERIVAERPEVARFKAELERTHALVQAAAQPESEPLRLAPERRAKLLAALGATPQAERAGESTVVAMPAARGWWQRRGVRVALSLGSAAAALAVAGFVVGDHMGGTFGGSERAAKIVELPVGSPEDLRLVKEARDREAAVSALRVARDTEATGAAAEEIKKRRAQAQAQYSIAMDLAPAGSEAAVADYAAQETAKRPVRSAPQVGGSPFVPSASVVAADATMAEPAARWEAVASEVARRRALRETAAAPSLAAAEPVRMDAFTVQAERDVGYAAASAMNAAPLINAFKAPQISLDFSVTAQRVAADAVAGADLASAPVAAPTRPDPASTLAVAPARVDAGNVVAGASASEGRTFILANGNISVTSAGGSNAINTSGGLVLSSIQDTTDFSFNSLGMLSSAAGTAAAGPTRGMEIGKSDGMNTGVSDKSVLVWDKGAFNAAGGETYQFAVPGSGNILSRVTYGAPMPGVGAGSEIAVTDSRVVAGRSSRADSATTNGGGLAVAEANTRQLDSVAVPGGGNTTFTAGRGGSGNVFSGAVAMNNGIIDTGLGGMRPGGAVGAGGSGVVSLNGIRGNITIVEDGDLRVGSIISGAAAAGPSRFGSVIEDTAVSNLGAVPPLQLGDSLALGVDAKPAAAPADGAIQLSAFSVSMEPRKAARGRAMVNIAPVSAPAPQAEPPVAVALPAITLPSGKGETVTAQEAVSTFSLHVSDVSFRLAQSTLAAMARGETPTKPTIRAEEIYNALDYDDPYPTEREKVRARIEQAAHPILQQRNLVRIALRVAATGRVAQQPLRLTILLDTSGSMEREDRRLAVRQALSRLMALLGPQDRVTLIGFARQPRLLAENVAGPQAVDLVRLAAETPPDGGTNLEAALTLARELALRHNTAGAQNRIVLLTDGAANLGDADPARLGTSVEALRQAGISFDACGVGLEGTGDAVLESLTRRGDGRYYVLDRAEAADVAFAAKIAGALRPAAENVKVQVRFNPARVGRYRLIGFEKHRLAEQDFRNDQVNAAELSAEEAAVAMYQVEALPEGTGDLGEVSVRFRDPATGEMVERTWTIPHEPQAPAFVRAAPSLQLAGFAAMLAEVLSESPVGEQIELAQLAPTANRLRTMYPQKPRVAELLTMYEQLRRLEKR